MAQIPVIISTDPGIDDAAAIALAFADARLDVQLIVPLYGNVAQMQTVTNTLRLLTFLNRRCKVVPGSTRPLLRADEDAADIHGKNGLGDYTLPPAAFESDASTTGVEAMHQVIQASSQKIAIAAIGPLTDVAILLHQHPKDCAKIAEITLMGGASGRGNVGAFSEFNFASDPEAAAMVFQSGVPILMAPMEIAHQAKVMPETLTALEKVEPNGRFFYRLFKHFRSGSFAGGLNMYDALAIALLAQPELFTLKKAAVQIELAGSYTAGASAINFALQPGLPFNAQVAARVDQPAFTRWLVAGLTE